MLTDAQREAAVDRVAEALWRKAAGKRLAGYEYDRLIPPTKDDLRAYADAALDALTDAGYLLLHREDVTTRTMADDLVLVRRSDLRELHAFYPGSLPDVDARAWAAVNGDPATVEERVVRAPGAPARVERRHRTPWAADTMPVKPVMTRWEAKQIAGWDKQEQERVVAQRDTAWDALREIETIMRARRWTVGDDERALDGIAAIISNGPLDTAPGGPREDECARLMAERDRYRDALQQIASTTAPVEQDDMQIARDALHGYDTEPKETT